MAVLGGGRPPSPAAARVGFLLRDLVAGGTGAGRGGLAGEGARSARPRRQPARRGCADPRVAAGLAARPSWPSGRVDLVVGHDFGGAVALALLDAARRSDLGAGGTARSAERGLGGRGRCGDRRGHAARRDAHRRSPRRAAQPDWTDDDCRQAVADLASARPRSPRAYGPAIAGRALDAARLSSPTLVLAAPDAAGVNRDENATTLRGDDRAAARVIADAFVEIDGGHCLHRDRPDAWLQAVTGFTG